MNNISSEGLVRKNINLSTFEKSHVVEAFGYGDIKFSKKGSEIKAALERHKEVYASEKEDLKLKMMICLQKFDDKPTEEPSEYLFRGVKNQVVHSPQFFSWEEIEKEDKEEARYMRKYNDIAREYIEKCVEIIHINNYISNFEDNKSYSLTPNQVATLGITKSEKDELSKGGPGSGRKGHKTANKELIALQSERASAWHAWNASKKQEDWEQVKKLDKYIKDLKGNKVKKGEESNLEKAYKTLNI